MIIKCSGEKKIEVFEMMCLKYIYGIRRHDRVRNALMRERYGCELSVVKTVDQNVLKCCGHVGRV